MNRRETPADDNLANTYARAPRRLLPALLVCTGFVVPVILALTHLAPTLATNPIQIVLAAGIASLVILAIFAILGARLVSLPASEIAPNSLEPGPKDVFSRHNSARAQLKKASPAEAAIIRMSQRALDDLALSNESRSDRRARMAALIAEVRAHAQSSVDPPQVSATASMALADNLATLLHESARCAHRAMELCQNAGADPIIDSRAGSTPTQRAPNVMCSLSDRSMAVNEMIDLIQSIAKQTNLLILSSALQAAREGEAGRRFAAEALKVKSLSGQIGPSPDQTAEKIATIKTSTEDAVLAMKTLTDLMRQADKAIASRALPVLKDPLQ